MDSDLRETLVIAAILFVSIFGMMTIKMIYGDDATDAAQANLARNFHVDQSQQAVHF